MKASDKARELLDKYRQYISMADKYQYLLTTDEIDLSKQCALIGVDELIKSNPTNPLTGGYIELYSDMVDEAIAFWQQVKTEIEKL
jgi:hypothetical protein